MDWVLGIVAVFSFAAGFDLLALALAAIAVICNVATVGVRLRARANGDFPDDGWVAPKLFTTIVLLSAVWCLAAQAGHIAS